jgi:DNA-binding XRE family transcriptional regulator
MTDTPEPVWMTGPELVAWRKRLGLTQETAAAALDCGRRSLQLWEKGKNSIPRYIRLATDRLEEHPEELVT